MTFPRIPRSDFYVYALFRADGITPFYIGKGRGQRIHIHERDARRNTSHKDRIIQAMLVAGLTVPKVKLIENLTDAEAKQIEIDLIQLLGRWPNGPLANLTRGGDGIIALAEESRARKSAANVIAWADPIVRERRLSGMRAAWTPELREIARQKQRAVWTPDLRARCGEVLKRAAARPEVKAARKASANKPSAIAKKRAAMIAIWADPSKRAARSAASKLAQSDKEYKERRKQIAQDNWKRVEIREAMMLSRRKYYLENPISREQGIAMGKRLNSPKSIEKRLATNARPDVRQKRIAAQKSAFSTPEAKAKRSAASKKMWAAKRAQNAVPPLTAPAPQQSSKPPQKHPSPAPHAPP